MPKPYAFQFNKDLVSDIILDAYERIGLSAEGITPAHIESAKRSANLLLSDWSNRGFNLWSLATRCISLYKNQRTYPLFEGSQPVPVTALQNVCLRRSTRKVFPDKGKAISETDRGSEGEADMAFDGDPTTSCYQDVPGGFIGYDFGEKNDQEIAMVGIQSNNDNVYKIEIMEGKDPAQSTPDFVQTVETLGLKGYLEWFELPLSPPIRAIGIRDLGTAEGAPGLDIQELYFNGDVSDTSLACLSASKYAILPQKFQAGTPTAYWFNRQVNPEINIWPVPDRDGLCLWFSYLRQFKDIDMILQADTPYRFFEPLASGLAFSLSVKFAPDKSGMLKQLYEEAFERASQEDTERVPLRIFATEIGTTWGEK